jgi:hypothetical protein
MQQPIWNFEQEPTDEPLDETGVNLRAYFDRMDDEKMRRYDSSWSDEQVIEVGEYRRVLEECIEYRDRVRGKLLG